ncbi:hypothetical protein R3P38DRAFT_2650559 [Favolaschia claudopus]
MRSTPVPRTSSSGSRPRAKDLDDDSKEYVAFASDHYRCLLARRQAFPDSRMETEMVREAWGEACEEMGERLVLTPAMAKLISSRGSQMRGEIKTKSRPLIDPMYGFESGQNKETVAANRKLAEHLKETSNFAYKVRLYIPFEIRCYNLPRWHTSL